MRQFRLPARGGFILGIWASIGFLAVAVLLFIATPIGGWAWAVWGLASAIALVALPYGATAGKITLGKRELRVRLGRTFLRVKRIPRRYVTGCALVTTPLQRLAGVTCLVVHTAGHMTILLGVEKRHAQVIADALEGKSE